MSEVSLMEKRTQRIRDKESSSDGDEEAEE